MYLGIKGVIAKSFARIHHSNLINFGLLPLVFKNQSDYEKIEPEDELVIEKTDAAVEKNEWPIKNKTKNIIIETMIFLTARQKKLLKLGGLLTYTREIRRDGGKTKE
jgi:aconitate hydratase